MSLAIFTAPALPEMNYSCMLYNVNHNRKWLEYIHKADD